MAKLTQLPGVPPATQAEFDRCIAIYHTIPKNEVAVIYARFLSLKRDSPMSVMRAFCEAFHEYEGKVIIMADGSVEYDDIIAGEKIYQEIQEG